MEIKSFIEITKTVMELNYSEITELADVLNTFYADYSDSVTPFITELRIKIENIINSKSQTL